MHRCTKEQALEVIRHPSVLKHLNIYPEDIKDCEIYQVGRAIVLLVDKGRSAEVHMACKLRDRAGLKPHLFAFLTRLKCRGFEEVFTTAPDDRTALCNMLKSLGFRKSEGKWVWA